MLRVTIICLGAAALVSSLLLTACAGDSEPEPRPVAHPEELSSAIRAWVSGTPDRAQEILSQVFEHDSKSFDAVYLRGVLRVDADPRGALRDLQQAAALDAKHPGPPMFTGVVQQSLSDFPGATRSFTQGLELAERRLGYSLPDTSDAAREGLRALIVGRPVAAHQAFSTALSTDAKNPVLWYLSGLAALRSGLTDSCLVAGTRALELRSRFPAAHSLLAAAYMREGQDALAREHIDAALAGNPRLADAYHQRALLALKRSEYRDAASDFCRAILEDPTVNDAYFSLARTLSTMRQGDTGMIFLQYAEWIRSAADRYHDRIPGR